MKYLCLLEKNINIVATLMLVVLLFSRKTRANTIHMLCVSAVFILYFYLFNRYRDLETVRLIIKIEPKHCIEFLTTRVRLTSSKSLPDLKNINLKSLLHAIYVRFIMKFISPIHRYLTLVKEIWLEIVQIIKLAKLENENYRVFINQ